MQNDVNGSAKVGREEQATESSSSMDLSSDIAWISRRIKSHSLQSSAVKEADKRQSSHHKEEHGIEEHVVTGKRDAKIRLSSEESMTTISKASGAVINHKADKHFGSGSSTSAENQTRENHEKYVEEEEKQVENDVLNIYPQVDMQKRTALINGVASSTEESALVLNGGGSTRRNHYVGGSIRNERKACRMETRNLVSEGRIHQLEQRIKILEGELREAAALEVSLYSVVAEHGCSMNKVHAPARRLSRLYFNANKQNPRSGRESASKSIVSGLVLAAKACGNDVPRYV